MTRVLVHNESVKFLRFLDWLNTFAQTLGPEGRVTIGPPNYEELVLISYDFKQLMVQFEKITEGNYNSQSMTVAKHTRHTRANIANAIAECCGVSASTTGKALDGLLAGDSQAFLSMLETATARLPKTGHPKENGNDLDLTPQQVAKLVAKSTLGRLHRRYEKLLKIKLPADGFKDVEQARLGAKLGTTFHNLQKCRRDIGLAPLEKPHQVTEAERLKTTFYSNHTKPDKKQATHAPARRDRAKPLPQTSLHR